MDKKNMPKRKHPRLDNFDYSSIGAYFITICTQDRKCLFSRVLGQGLAPAEINAVGRGLAPAETKGIEYTTFGKIAEQQLLSLEERYSCLAIDKYVIMPNHIHIILILNNDAAGASPRPTIMDILCTYKSLTTRECKKIGFNGKLFQTSFFEHIIRDRKDYETRIKYIHENPMRWYYDELYMQE